MKILPAIDLKDGQCVRLFKGEFDTAHRVSDDPLETLEMYVEAGAEIVHMVDLDGAGSGLRKNFPIILKACAAAARRIKIQLGGGIRSMHDIEAVFEAGVYRAVIGSMAVSDPDFVREAVGRYGNRVAVGIDAKDGIVKTLGWQDSSGVHFIELARAMESMGVSCLILTDINRDGMMRGPNIDMLYELRQTVSCEVIASGGVTVIEDIEALKRINMDGAIIGKALHEGSIDLVNALEVAR